MYDKIVRLICLHCRQLQYNYSGLTFCQINLMGIHNLSAVEIIRSLYEWMDIKLSLTPLNTLRIMYCYIVVMLYASLHYHFIK